MSLNPPFPPLFDEMCNVQKSTDELVGWSSLARRLVVMDYPTYANGRRVPPPNYAKWLEVRGLLMACFCAATSEDNVARPVRIVLLGSQYFALCRSKASGCGYQLNITEVYEYATLESAYRHLPTATHGEPDMPYLLARFFMQPTAARVRIGIAERFPGFIGDHKSRFEAHQATFGLEVGRQVLGKRSRAPEPFPMPKQLPDPSSASTRILRRPRRDRSLPSIDEVDVREAELCTRCMCLFPYDVLRRHILEEACERVSKRQRVE